MYSSLMLGLFDSSTIGNEVRRISSGPKRSFILEKLQEPRTKEVSLNWTQAYKKDFIILFQLFSSKKNSNEGNKTACYPDLGCFTKNRFGKLPSSLESIGTTMWLYTRNNLKKGQKLKYNKKKTITKSNFDPSKDTKFIIHGFGGSCKLKVLKKLRPALLKAVSNPNSKILLLLEAHLSFLFKNGL